MVPVQTFHPCQAASKLKPRRLIPDKANLTESQRRSFSGVAYAEILALQEKRPGTNMIAMENVRFVYV